MRAVWCQKLRLLHLDGAAVGGAFDGGDPTHTFGADGRVTFGPVTVLQTNRTRAAKPGSRINTGGALQMDADVVARSMPVMIVSQFQASVAAASRHEAEAAPSSAAVGGGRVHGVQGRKPTLRRAGPKHTCGRARDAVSAIDAAQLAGFSLKAAADDADDDEAAKVKAEVERLHTMADPLVDAELLKTQPLELLRSWFTDEDARLIRKGDAAKVKARGSRPAS